MPNSQREREHRLKSNIQCSIIIPYWEMKGENHPSITFVIQWQQTQQNYLGWRVVSGVSYEGGSEVVTQGLWGGVGASAGWPGGGAGREPVAHPMSLPAFCQ